MEPKLPPGVACICSPLRPEWKKLRTGVCTTRILLPVHRADGSRRERCGEPAGGWGVAPRLGRAGSNLHAELLTGVQIPPSRTSNPAPRGACVSLFYLNIEAYAPRGSVHLPPEPEAHGRWTCPLARRFAGSDAAISSDRPYDSRRRCRRSPGSPHRKRPYRRTAQPLAWPLRRQTPP
jgi:hypothetical protein